MSGATSPGVSVASIGRSRVRSDDDSVSRQTFVAMR